MFAKKDAVDKQKFSRSMQKVHAGDEVEMNGEQINEAASLTADHKNAITKHIKKMWGKGEINFDKQDGKHFVSHSDGIQTHVHSIHMKKGVPHVTHFMSMDESVEQIDELKKSALQAVRNRASGRMMDDPNDNRAANVERQASSRLKKITDAEKEASSKRAYSAYKEEFIERAIAILGEDYADLSFEQLVEEVAKRGRGRPRKDGSTGPKPAPTGPKRGRGRPRKDAAPAASSSSSAPAEAGDREHILMALRKSVSLRGQHHVKFANGESHQISAEHATHALRIHDSLSKPSEKMAFQRKLGASHDSFKNALKDKNPGGEEAKKSSITLAKRAD